MVALAHADGTVSLCGIGRVAAPQAPPPLPLTGARRAMQRAMRMASGAVRCATLSWRTRRARRSSAWRERAQHSGCSLALCIASPKCGRWLGARMAPGWPLLPVSSTPVVVTVPLAANACACARSRGRGPDGGAVVRGGDAAGGAGGPHRSRDMCGLAGARCAALPVCVPAAPHTGGRGRSRRWGPCLPHARTTALSACTSRHPALATECARSCGRRLARRRCGRWLSCRLLLQQRQ